MKVKEIRLKSEKELRQLLQEKREHLRQYLFDLAGKKLKNVRQIRATRRDIARILTLLKLKTKSLPSAKA